MNIKWLFRNKSQSFGDIFIFVVCLINQLEVLFLLLIQVRKESHIYVNSPWMSKEDGPIELLSFKNSTEAEREMQPGEENKALDSPEEDEKELKTNEDFLTPGDLMAFAWQITQGMVNAVIISFNYLVRYE